MDGGRRNVSNNVSGQLLIARDYIETCLVNDSNKSFMKTQVLARGAYCILAPASFIGSIFDILPGICFGVGSICTFGKCKSLDAKTWKFLSSSHNLLTTPYANLLNAINPGAYINSESAKISYRGNGFVSHKALKFLNKQAKRYCNSESFLEKHVSSRLIYVLLQFLV